MCSLCVPRHVRGQASHKRKKEGLNRSVWSVSLKGRAGSYVPTVGPWELPRTSWCSNLTVLPLQGYPFGFPETFLKTFLGSWERSRVPDVVPRNVSEILGTFLGFWERSQGVSCFEHAPRIVPGYMERLLGMFLSSGERSEERFWGSWQNS